MESTVMKQILSDMNEGKYKEVRNKLINFNVVDVANFLGELEDKEMVILFRILPKDLGAETFSHLEDEEKEYIINNITDKETSNIIDSLYLDDAVDMVEELPANVVKKILRNTNSEKRELINQYLNYPEDSAGSIMTIEYVDLKKKLTVREAIERIREIGIDRETIDTCYVTDFERKLEGVISIRKLILSDEDKTLEEIMGTYIIKINTLEDQEEVAEKFKKYDFFTMPVVDNEDRLVGIITLDDVVDIIESENTEDFQKMAAMSPSDEPYLKTNPFILAKNRLIWLAVLMLSATFTARIIGKYEGVLETSVILTAFIPMLMDTAGNAGSQSSTLIIRSLALGEIQLKDALKVLFKEFQVSIIAGISLGVLNYLRLIYLEQVDSNVALTVSVTVVVTVILAKIVGGMLPMAAKVLKLDPAIMAGPLITTIVDAAALVVYFQVATKLLNL